MSHRGHRLVLCDKLFHYRVIFFSRRRPSRLKAEMVAADKDVAAEAATAAALDAAEEAVRGAYDLAHEGAEVGGDNVGEGGEGYLLSMPDGSLTCLGLSNGLRLPPAGVFSGIEPLSSSFWGGAAAAGGRRRSPRRRRRR